jgi:hypothetical protein
MLFVSWKNKYKISKPCMIDKKSKNRCIDLNIKKNKNKYIKLIMNIMGI